MRAKCKYCGRIITSAPFYKVTVGGKNSYYCNQQEYDTVRKQAQIRDNVFLICSEILNRPADALINKEVSAWLQVANYEKISAYLTEYKGYIIDQMARKDFQNIYGQTRYFSAIVKNNLPVYKMPQPEIQKDPPEMCEVKPYNYSRKRKCLSEILMDEDGEDNE
jgi:hypothetical protein